VGDLRFLDQCVAAGFIPAEVVLGLSAKTWLSALEPFAKASETADEILVFGRPLPASVTQRSLLNARTWLSIVYAVRVYADAHGCLPKELLRLPLVDRAHPEPAAAQVGFQRRNADPGGSAGTVTDQISAASADVPFCARRPAAPLARLTQETGTVVGSATI
jgi:hypothetical protein